jgi:hypothetical protein
MTITSIALGESDASNLLEEAKELTPELSRVFIAMCTEGGEAQCYITNMNNAEVSFLLLSCLLETHGAFDQDD